MSPREVIRIFFRHRRKMIAFFVSVATASVIVTLICPKTYRSEAKLFVRLGRENVGVDPTATMGEAPVVAIPQSRENELNSVVELLHNRVLFQRVVDTVGPAVVLGPDKVAGNLWRRPMTPLKMREKAIRLLQKELYSKAADKSDVILVAYETYSAEAARKVVAALVDAYLDQHVRLNRTAGVREFFADQTKQARGDLTNAEQQLKTLKNDTGLISPVQQRQILVQRMGRLQDELYQVDAAVAATKTEVKQLSTTWAGLSATRVTARTSGIDNRAADGMRQQLYALQLRQQELKAKYTIDHPEVREVQEQIAKAKALLATESEFRTQTIEGPNRSREEVELTLMRQEAQLASMSAKAETLNRQLNQVYDEMETLTEHQSQIADLEREVQLLDVAYRKYAESLEQSRVDRALEDNRISNISVAQPATLERKPVRPRMLVSLALGLGLAGFGSIVLGLGAEYMDQTLKGPEDIEEKLGLPTVLSIPRFEQTSLSANGEN